MHRLSGSVQNLLTLSCFKIIQLTKNFDESLKLDGAAKDYVSRGCHNRVLSSMVCFNDVIFRVGDSGCKFSEVTQQCEVE